MGKWYTSLKLVTTAQPGELAAAFGWRKFETLEMDPPGAYWNLRHPPGFLLLSPLGYICALPPGRNSKTALRLFWKTMVLHEFVILKNRIYDDYAIYLREEINKTKKARLHKTGVQERQPAQHGGYDTNLVEYLRALDRHSRSAPPFYRRIYSFLSNGLGFDRKHLAIERLLTDWRSETDLTDSALTQFESSTRLYWVNDSGSWGAISERGIYNRAMTKRKDFLWVDISNHEWLSYGRPVHLSRLERKFVRFLLENAKEYTRFITLEDIIISVWERYEVRQRLDQHLVEVNLSRLREKIGPDLGQLVRKAETSEDEYVISPNVQFFYVQRAIEGDVGQWC